MPREAVHPARGRFLALAGSALHADRLARAGLPGRDEQIVDAPGREGQLVVLESTTYPGTTRELLEPSDLRTVCAYKGRASYWSIATCSTVLASSSALRLFSFSIAATPPLLFSQRSVSRQT